MSATWVQTKSAITASAVSISVSLTGVGAGNHLNAYVEVNFAGIPLTVTTSTPAATWLNAIANFTNPTGGRQSRNDYSENVASGTWTITGNGSAADSIFVCASESSGVATSASLGVTSTNAPASPGTTIQPGSVTPAAGSILYTEMGGTIAGTSGNAAGTIDSGFTVDEVGGVGTVWDSDTFAAVGGTAHLNNVTAAATNPTWTENWVSGAAEVASIVEFKAAAAAAAKVPYNPWLWRGPWLAT